MRHAMGWVCPLLLATGLDAKAGLGGGETIAALSFRACDAAEARPTR